MSDFIVLKKVRLAFPNLRRARSQKNDDGSDGILKYDAVFLIDPSTPEGKETFAELKAEVVAVGREKWGAKADQLLVMLRDQKRLCFNPGPFYDQNGNPRPGWEDAVAVNGFRYADQGAPGLFDAHLNPLGDDPQGVIYAGCHVHAKLRVFAWDHAKYGKRVRAEILAVMFAEDGDAFRGGSAADASGMESLAAPAGDGDGDADTSASGLL